MEHHDVMGVGGWGLTLGVFSHKRTFDYRAGLSSKYSVVLSLSLLFLISQFRPYLTPVSL